MNKELMEKVKAMGLLQHEYEYFASFDTFSAFWGACTRGDRMLWLCGKLAGRLGDIRRKKLVTTACKCARLVLRYATDDRAKTAIETSEKWAMGATWISIEDVRNAGFASSFVSASASASAYVADADAAAYAASYAAAYTAASAAYAAVDAYNTAIAAAAGSVAYTATLKKCADIVRKSYTSCEVEKYILTY
jgi:hypothetical protein